MGASLETMAKGCALVLRSSLNKNLGDAATDVQAAISWTEGFLPTDVPQPPSFQKTNPNDRPIFLYSGAVAAAVSHDAAATTIPNPTLPNTARPGCAIAGLGRPFSLIAKAAARFMQIPDQASSPSASDGRCQPANKTPVANIELTQPPATANHGRQRDDETKSKLKARAVPMVACPLGVGASLEASLEQAVIGHRRSPW